LLNFRYGQVGIRDLAASTYLAKQDPVAATLAVLMKTRKQSRAAVKLTALQTVIQSNLSPGDKLFLVELANTYAPTAELSDPREEIMQALTEIDMTWGEQLREEGREEGLIDGERKMLLRLLTLMFGPLPAEFVQRIQVITDEAVLETLSQQLVHAKSLADLVLPETPPSQHNHS
jgi:hypothetical protein